MQAEAAHPGPGPTTRQSHSESRHLQCLHSSAGHAVREALHALSHARPSCTYLMDLGQPGTAAAAELAAEPGTMPGQILWHCLQCLQKSGRQVSCAYGEPGKHIRCEQVADRATSASMQVLRRCCKYKEPSQLSATWQLARQQGLLRKHIILWAARGIPFPLQLTCTRHDIVGPRPLVVSELRRQCVRAWPSCCYLASQASNGSKATMAMVAPSGRLCCMTGIWGQQTECCQVSSALPGAERMQQARA